MQDEIIIHKNQTEMLEFMEDINDTKIFKCKKCCWYSHNEICLNPDGAAVSAIPPGHRAGADGSNSSSEAHMHDIIHESLSRQEKALCLLRDLLEEEYSSLLSRDIDTVVSLEFSVQELIRHLALEKTFVIKRLGGMRVAEYADALPDDLAVILLETLRSIDASEQDVARQASRNTTLSLALLDQSSRTRPALTKQAMPPKAETYGRRGGMRTQHPQAALISGRL